MQRILRKIVFDKSEKFIEQARTTKSSFFADADGFHKANFLENGPKKRIQSFSFMDSPASTLSGEGFFD